MSGLTSISVCVFGTPGERSGIRRLLGKAGTWPVIEAEALDDLPPSDTTPIALFILATNGDANEALFSMLRVRAEGMPLVVIGKNPAHAARPDLWLPSAPKPQLLGAVVTSFIGSDTPKSPWRRKADMILGTSRQMRDLLHTLDQLAPAQTAVHISGESGVGKELVARALHFSSPRAAAPFVALNCGAFPETLLEAELFGYQKGAFTGAVATNRDLSAEVKAGRFREDLYYRIHVYPISVPALRERPEDIPPIANHYMLLIAEREKRPALRLSSAAVERLLAHTWPGNVRELINTLERAAVMAGDQEIDAQHVMLPTTSDSQRLNSPILPYKDAKQQFERDYYSRLMRVAEGNISLASKLGQKTRKEIYDALKRLGLEMTEFRVDS